MRVPDRARFESECRLRPLLSRWPLRVYGIRFTWTLHGSEISVCVFRKLALAVPALAPVSTGVK